MFLAELIVGPWGRLSGILGMMRKKESTHKCPLIFASAAANKAPI